jgi:cyanophycin synthetase
MIREDERQRSGLLRRNLKAGASSFALSLPPGVKNRPHRATIDPVELQKSSTKSQKIKINALRILSAGNLYAPVPVVRLRLLTDERPGINALPELAQTIMLSVPSAGSRQEEKLDFPAWRLMSDGAVTATPERLVEALALLLQRWVGWPVGFSAAELGAEAPPAAAIFETRNPEVGLLAGEFAVDLVNAAASEDPARLSHLFAERFEDYRVRTNSTSLGRDSFNIAKRAGKRGIPWTPTPVLPYMRLGHGRHIRFTHGSETSLGSSMASRFAKEKAVSCAFLAAAALPVPQQRTAATVEEALDGASWLGYPVVIKPATGNLGRSVFVGVSDELQVREAFKEAQSVSREVVIEAMIKGEEHRLLVVGGKFFAASQRRPAQVKGDGVSTIRQLVDRENRRPERQGSQNVVLKPLKIDKTARECLAERGLSPDTILAVGQPAVLRRVSNISQGGTAHDITDKVHPSVRDMAERAATTLGIDVCGVDYITTDIGKPFFETGGAICEVNTRPGLDLHTDVVEGVSRDAAEAILAMLYPDGAPSRVPVVVVLRQAGETGLEGEVFDAAVAAGRHAGLASSRSTSIGPEATTVPSKSLSESVTAVLTTGNLDCAIVAATPDEVVRQGIGLDRVDLAILPSDLKTPAAEEACRVLVRLAKAHVTDTRDGAALDRALAVLDVPRAGNRSSTAPAGAERARAPAARHDAGDRPDFVMMMVGDIAFGESYSQRRDMTPLRWNLAIHGHRYSLARLTTLFEDADLLVGNLEVPLAATPNETLRQTKDYLHWCDPNETVAALVEAGFDALSVANNHTLDCGDGGLRDTLRLAEASGIAAFGAGDDTASAGRPFIRTARIGGLERTIVVFAGFEFRQKYAEQFDWYAKTGKFGVNALDPDAVATEIARLRATLPNPLFIAYPHWGVDYRATRQYQRELAVRLVDAGVDLVIGHGAHSIQGIETVAGRPVLYGLGNFVFNSPGRFEKSGAPPYGVAATLRFHRRGDEVSTFLRLYPLLIDNRKSGFQNRPVSALEFPEALAVLTRDYGPGEPATGIDAIGHYCEIPVRL